MYNAMRKLWMWTIHGLGCSKHGSVLVQTIHELLAQSVDRAKRKAQSMDLDNPVILTYAIWQAVWVSMQELQAWSYPIAYHCKIRLLFPIGKLGKYIAWKMEAPFKLVQTVAPSWLEIRVQYCHYKGDFLNLSTNFSFSFMCDQSTVHTFIWPI